MIAVVAIMVIILIIQAPSLLLQKQWWDLAVFLVFWIAASVYALLMAAQVNIPSPSIIITTLIKSIFS